MLQQLAAGLTSHSPGAKAGSPNGKMRSHNRAAGYPETCENCLSSMVRNHAMAQSLGESGKVIRYPGFFTLLFGWTLLGGLSCVRHILLDHVPHADIAREMAGWLTCYFPWVLLTPLVFWLERRLPLSPAHWRRHALLLVAAALPICYVSASMAVAASMLEQLAFREPLSVSSQWLRMPNGEYVFQIALYFVAMFAAWMIRTLMEMQESERRAAQLALEKSEIEASLRKSELEMLRTRLNPHFLFNSLQNISTLARQNPDAASQMLARLGDVLRAALRKGTPVQTNLASEIALTKAFVEVEQIRFGGRLSVLFEIDRQVDNALVPSFLLQPLVENAITHGLRGGQAS